MNILRPYTDIRNGEFLTLGDCAMCGRKLTRSTANKTGARCPYEGAQYDKDGKLLYDAATKPSGRAVAPKPKRHGFTICERSEPTCGRGDCDPSENPEHWVDVELEPLELAAPDLLAACAEMLRCQSMRESGTMPKLSDWTNAHTAARLAIAKATKTQTQTA